MVTFSDFFSPICTSVPGGSPDLRECLCTNFMMAQLVRVSSKGVKSLPLQRCILSFVPTSIPATVSIPWVIGISKSRTSVSMEQELATLSDTMLRAGREALRLAADGFETHTKQDRSPVTSADLAVNQILRDSLSAAYPDDGWLSEETPDAPDRLGKKRVWIVDPIDGTRSFVRGLPEFCLSVALIEEGLPAVAAIYNPSTGEFFSAIR